MSKTDPSKSVFVQDSFSAGLDMFTDRTKLPTGAYPLLINGRSRYGKIRPIRKPKLLGAGLPSTAAGYNYQGLYGVGNFAIVFANGQAYVRDYSTDSSENFNQVANFQMSTGAPQLWLEVVPASTINCKRVSPDEEASSSVTLLNELSAPSPVAAVVQDGISQPWIILNNGSARVTKNFDQWQNSADGREYVPIGKQMLFVDGKLYITDGKQVFQSVSGRPLDFVISIDAEGNKLESVDAGGAQNNSTRPFYDTITCLGRIASDDGSFYVGSPRNSVITSPDFSETQYNEPFFTHKYIANTGPLNNESFIGDVNGDTCFIDGKTIRSFNAILTVKNTGKNAPFSLLISRLFDSVDQSNHITCAGQFDNYSLFSLNTVYGPAIVWYDELRQCWDGIDIYDNVYGSIRQFAQVLTDTGERKLLFLTSAGKVYEWGAAEEVAMCSLYIGDFCSSDPKTELDMGTIKVILEQAETAGITNATLFVDNQKQLDTILAKAITKDFTAPSGPIDIPFGSDTNRSVNNLAFDFSRAKDGYKVGVLLQWNVLANLTYVAASDVGLVTMSGNTMKQQQSSYLQNRTTLGL